MSNPIPQSSFDNAKEALKIAKITMMMQKDTCFYTAILMSLQQHICDEFQGFPVTTAATDGKHLMIHPDFFFDLSLNERITLLAHEALHVALDHMHRKGDRDHQLWNVAGDYVINYALVKADYKLPAGGLYDAQYANMSTVQVYNLLVKKSDQEKQSLIGKCAMDIQYPENATPGNAVSQDAVTEIILRATTQAKAMNQTPGSLPGEIDIQLQHTLNPPLPWNIILQNFMTERAKDDYTFRRPNRRYMPQHYLPSAYSEAMANLAIIVDASSSVNDANFNDFINKVAEMQKMVNPKKITVVAFNTKIVSEQILTEKDNPLTQLKFKGRGGTSIAPVHQWIADNKPTVALIFTDGEFYKADPKNKTIPLIWLIYENPQWTADFGRVVHYEPPKK